MSNEWCLVTGGAGFIGSAFVRRLLATNAARVVTLDKLTYAGHRATLRAVEGDRNHVLIAGDIRDGALVKEILGSFLPTAIVHFAAESHVDRSIDGPRAFVETNLGGTFEVLDAARRYYASLEGQERQDFRFLHVSTDEVYGSLGKTGAFSETSPYAPNSPYAATKAGSDLLVRSYHHTYGLPTLTTHCSNNLGPYQFPEKLVPRMIRCALRGERLPVYGDGQNVRDWLYVEDHIDALLAVLRGGRPGETYAIGGGSERKNIDLVRAVCQVLDEAAPPAGRGLGAGSYGDLISFVADRPGHDLRYAIDASKIGAELGWRPRHSFEHAVERTVRWYLDNEAWCEEVLSASPADERLGLGGGAR